MKLLLLLLAGVAAQKPPPHDRPWDFIARQVDQVSS